MWNEIFCYEIIYSYKKPNSGFKNFKIGATIYCEPPVKTQETIECV